MTTNHYSYESFVKRTDEIKKKTDVYIKTEPKLYDEYKTSDSQVFGQWSLMVCFIIGSIAVLVYLVSQLDKLVKKEKVNKTFITLAVFFLSNFCFLILNASPKINKAEVIRDDIKTKLNKIYDITLGDDFASRYSVPLLDDIYNVKHESFIVKKNTFSAQCDLYDEIYHSNRITYQSDPATKKYVNKKGYINEVFAERYESLREEFRDNIETKVVDDRKRLASISSENETTSVTKSEGSISGSFLWISGKSSSKTKTTSQRNYDYMVEGERGFQMKRLNEEFKITDDMVSYIETSDTPSVTYGYEEFSDERFTASLGTKHELKYVVFNVPTGTIMTSSKIK